MLEPKGCGEFTFYKLVPKGQEKCYTPDPAMGARIFNYKYMIYFL